MTDGQGGPLGAVIDGANVPDQKLLHDNLDAVVVERPDPGTQPQHLCLDKGYDNPRSREAVASHGYVGHIRRIGEEAAVPRGKRRHKPRRWVVERTFGWLCKCRAICTRYDKNAFNYLGLIQLACPLFWFRRPHRTGKA